MATRIPVSTTQMPPKVAALSGIRAPLTLDESDFEFSAKTRLSSTTTSSYHSGSELDDSIDGFISGDSDSEFNDEVQQTQFVNEFAIAKPLVKNPTGNISVQETSNASRNSFSRPYVSSFKEYDDSDEDSSVNGDDYVGISRPVVSVTSKDVAGNAILGVSSVSGLHRPVAVISGDSDDDVSEGSVVLEDDDLSGVFRTPRVGLLQKINSAPKVRTLDVKEDLENESDYGSTLEGEDNEEMVINDEVLGIENEEALIDVVENVQADLLSKMSQNEGLDSDIELSSNTLVVNGEINCMSGSEISGDLAQMNDDKHDLDVTDDMSECITSCNSGELPDLFKESLSVSLGEEHGCSSGLELTEINGGDDVIFDQDFESCNGETKTESESVDGAGCSCELARLEITDTNGEDSSVIDQDFESCNEETKTESESIDGAIEMEEVPSINCPRFLEFPETVIESEHVDTIDRLLGINHSDASQLVLLNTELDHQRNNSQEEINEPLPLGNKNLMFHSCSVEDEIECEEASYSAYSGETLRDHFVELDDIIVRDAYEDVETVSGVHDSKNIIESSVKSVLDVYDGKFTSIDGVDILPLERDSTDLVSMFRSAIPVCGPINAEFFTPLTGELEKDRSEGENENLEQIERIREKYLWLLHKLGRSCGDLVAMELEEQNKIDSDFSLSILVIGKTGVGKSATINSIFGEKKIETDAFGPATKSVKETVATVNGLKVKVLDTPGLRTSRSDLPINHKILSSIKRSIKKSPPDVVLYVDRLDMQTCDFTDLPIFRLITAYLGSSIWRKSIIVLSHAASLPPDELFVDQRSSFIQKMIFRLYGDSVYPGNIVPVSLVENDSLYKESNYGEKLLFLCYSMKILLELNSVVATNDSLSCPDLSFVRWKGDIISGCNLQCNVGVGTNSKLHITTDLKEKPCGGVSIRTRGSDQVQIVVIALLLISKALFGNVFPSQKSSS